MIDIGTNTILTTLSLGFISQSLRRLATFKSNDQCIVEICGNIINCETSYLLFISKNVFDQYKRNNKARRFKFECNIHNNETMIHVSQFLKTGEMPEELSAEIVKDIFRVGKCIGSEILQTPYIDYVQNMNITQSNSLAAYKFLRKHGNASHVINFISSNLYSYTEEELVDFFSHYDYKLYEEVLTNPNLIVSSEDQLIKLFLNLSRNNTEFHKVSHHMRIDAASRDVYDEFLHYMDNYSLVDANWNSIWKFTRNQFTFSRYIDRYIRTMMFAPNNTHKFNGITQYFEDRNAKGSIYTNFSTRIGYLDSIFYDFKNYSVSLNGLSISYAAEHNNVYTKLQQNFYIEGSNDCIGWDVIDNKLDAYSENDLDNYTFAITPSQFYRQIRIRNTKDHWYSNVYLKIDKIEFFGILKYNQTLLEK